MPHLRVELDPVDDPRPRAKQHVLAAQVAVPVAHLACADPPLDLPAMSAHERLGEVAHHLWLPAAGVIQVFKLP